jgi:hypothetical protein
LIAADGPRLGCALDRVAGPLLVVLGLALIDAGLSLLSEEWRPPLESAVADAGEASARGCLVPALPPEA